MTDRHRPIMQGLAVLALLTSALSAPAAAHADVVGRLKISVKNAADEKPLANAKIVLKDTASIRPSVTLTTDAAGVVTTPQLEARAWSLAVSAEKADTFEAKTQDATVVADTVTEVEVLLEPIKPETTITIRGAKDLIQRSNTTNDSHRDQSFISKIPLTAGNPQSLQKVTQATPGAAQDSVNQVHFRGEHSDTSLRLDGYTLAGVMQGRAGPIISPEVIQNIDVLTGGYAPEYGGEMAAVLNVSLRAGPIQPLRSYLFQGGEFSTYFGSLQFGGQAGAPLGQPDADGNQPRKFGYFLNVNARATDNALEPPQPGNQTSHNHGESQTYFGNFGYKLSDRDNLTLTLNEAPAYTHVANRTGLPDSFADVGQGYGYAGHLSRVDAAAAGIGTQQAAGQDIYQRDQNEFGAINLRHTFNDHTSGLFSIGVAHAGLDILNHSPNIDINNLPNDSSIEFNPTVRRHAHDLQLQGSLSVSRGTHTFKTGLLTDEQEGNESYHIVPGSQLAVDGLAAVDTRFLAPGTFQTDGQGNPVLDDLGNQVYQLSPNAVVPLVSVKHTGFYRAFYAQDTWNVNRKFTMNYGARLDWYKADVTVLGGETNSIDTVHVSPRINLAYTLASRTILRADYNRMFSQPPLSQDAVLGQATPPQTGDLYETSLERQLSPTQTAKIAYYYKDWRNFADTGLLVPGTQLGIFTTFSHPHVMIHGVEFSYDVTPRNNVGLGGYLTWANAVNRLLAPEDGFTDHDQLNTIGLGMSWTWANQANVGLNVYHGSGVASSVIRDTRTPRTVVSVRVASQPNLFGGTAKDGRGGLSLDIENLFDDRSVINFQSAFSGTRFQQGRRIILSANGRF